MEQNRNKSLLHQELLKLGVRGASTYLTIKRETLRGEREEKENAGGREEAAKPMVIRRQMDHRRRGGGFLSHFYLTMTETWDS